MKLNVQWEIQDPKTEVYGTICLAIFCGDIPFTQPNNLGLKNLVATSNQSAPDLATDILDIIYIYIIYICGGFPKWGYPN